MKKIDIHMHLSLAQQEPTDKMFISSAENMLPHMEELGIQKAVLMSSGENTDIFGSNEENRRIAEQYPEHFAWMCNVDPVHMETVEKRLATYKEQGAVGVGELMINQRMDSPFLQAVFGAAERLGLPITFHMSPEEGYSYGIVDEPGLPLLEKTLKKYSSLRIFGHSQSFWIEISKDAPKAKEARNSWGKGPVIPGGRVPQLFETYSNLYGDLSANSAGQAIMRDPEFGIAFLTKYSDRLCFATDMVNTQMSFPLGDWLDQQVKAGTLTQNVYNKICRENAKRIFGI